MALALSQTHKILMSLEEWFRVWDSWGWISRPGRNQGDPGPQMPWAFFCLFPLISGSTRRLLGGQYQAVEWKLLACPPLLPLLTFLCCSALSSEGIQGKRKEIKLQTDAMGLEGSSGEDVTAREGRTGAHERISKTPISSDSSDTQRWLVIMSGSPWMFFARLRFSSCNSNPDLFVWLKCRWGFRRFGREPRIRFLMSPQRTPLPPGQGSHLK
jgi:hypothetical protein